MFKQKKEVETASTNSSLLVPHGGNGAPYNQYRCDHDGDDDDDDDDYVDDDYVEDDDYCPPPHPTYSSFPPQNPPKNHGS